MKDEKLLNQVEKHQLTVKEYLDYKAGLPIRRPNKVSKVKFRKSKGFKLVIIKGNFIIMPPRIPISLLKFVSKYLFKYKNLNGKIDIERVQFDDLIKSFKEINRNTMLIDVESKNEGFLFQIWSV